MPRPRPEEAPARRRGGAARRRGSARRRPGARRGGSAGARGRADRARALVDGAGRGVDDRRDCPRRPVGPILAPGRSLASRAAGDDPAPREPPDRRGRSASPGALPRRAHSRVRGTRRDGGPAPLRAPARLRGGRSRPGQRHRGGTLLLSRRALGGFRGRRFARRGAASRAAQVLARDAADPDDLPAGGLLRRRVAGRRVGRVRGVPPRGPLDRAGERRCAPAPRGALPSRGSRVRDAGGLAGPAARRPDGPPERLGVPGGVQPRHGGPGER